MSKVILFQGDSITDCGRDRNNAEELGKGYARNVAGTLGLDYPEKYTFYNRGISGNRIVDIYARIKKDIINLAPDYMSILVGVNDVGHEIAYDNGVSPEKFEKIYTMLLEEVFEALPDIKVFIMLPFILEGTGTVNTETNPDRWERFRDGVAATSAAAKRVAEKFSLPYIDLQKVFDKACENVPSAYYSADGVHPTVYGHKLIEREWIKAFRNL